MSFSSDIKQKILTKGVNANILDCCLQAELLGILRTCINLQMSVDTVKMSIFTENIVLAGYITKLVSEFYNIELYGEYLANTAKTVLTYENLRDDVALQELLQDVGLQLGDNNFWFNPIAITRRCCQRAFMRGMFLAIGSVTDPEKSYHLEFVFKDAMLAEELVELLQKNKINAKIVDRKKSTVVYVKECENIALFFNIIGAHHALLEIENITIVKEIRNNVNRITNCELANLSKTVASASRQIECIKTIREKGKFDDLPDSLKEVAILREKYPEYSLTEIGNCMSEPIGRSGVNHRLKKLEQLAKA